jgi:hypothetical protein
MLPRHLNDDTRPLSEGWEGWLPPGASAGADQVDMELARELSRPEPSQSQWSADTEAQFKIALKTNVYFTQVSWSGVKCSIDGCIVAWEIPKRQLKAEQSCWFARLPRCWPGESFDVMTQVLSQLPNRASPLRHADHWRTETHQNAKYSYLYVYFVYFYFPEALGEN